MIPPNATRWEARWIIANMDGQRERRAGKWGAPQVWARAALGHEEGEREGGER